MQDSRRALPPDPSGRKLGPFWLSPGISRGNAATLLFGGFSTICLVTFLSFVQPYLFNVVLSIPKDEQGALGGLLVSLQEVVQVVLAGFIGAISDRSGRRLVYVTGLVGMSLGLVIYPLAGTANELIAYRIFYSIGMTSATVMMSTCFAEYSQDTTRGRWMGTVGVCNGLGVVLTALVLAKAPLYFGKLGLGEVDAIRFSIWTVAAYTLLLALAMRLGLQGPGNQPRPRHGSMLRQAAFGLAAARDNPRIALAYATAFASRGDLTILTTFISLWVVQAGMGEGLSAGAATARAGMIFGTAQGVALIWSFVMGAILDRVPRLTGVCIAFGLAAGGYLALGAIDDPFGRWMLPAAMLAGIGEASAVVTSGVLIGQEAPAQNRGTIFGTFALGGSIGIICLSYGGGQVFDIFGRNAPFTLMGIVNCVVLAAAFFLRRREAASLLAGPGIPAPAPVPRRERPGQHK